ncbi:MAG: DUF3387 domain-containing protein [Deltaproteobacteria bacterium]|nr:DUF3387 domain-containing protein [Deltaproteobacteria bacterium]
MRTRLLHPNVRALTRARFDGVSELLSELLQLSGRQVGIRIYRKDRRRALAANHLPEVVRHLEHALVEAGRDAPVGRIPSRLERGLLDLCLKEVEPSRSLGPTGVVPRLPITGRVVRKARFEVGARRLGDRGTDRWSVRRQTQASQAVRVRERLLETLILSIARPVDLLRVGRVPGDPLDDVHPDPERLHLVDERNEVKKVARDLLARIRSILTVDWQKTAQARARVRDAIEQALDDGLPPAYTPDVFKAKAGVVFQHVYERYGIAA